MKIEAVARTPPPVQQPPRTITLTIEMTEQEAKTISSQSNSSLYTKAGLLDFAKFNADLHAAMFKAIYV
jgi:hypothetical protein